MKSKLSLLWTFATVNYLYCDVVTLMDPNAPKAFNAGFLLAASVLVEIPMAMIIASRLLGDRSSRWANVVAGALMTAVQAATLGVKVPAPYYLFFSVIEMATTATIVWLAWRSNRDHDLAAGVAGLDVRDRSGGLV